MYLHLVEQFMLCSCVFELVDIVIFLFSFYAVEVKDIDSYGFFQLVVIEACLQLFGVESSPVIERPFGVIFLIYYLHLDIEPFALGIDRLDIENRELVIAEVFCVIRVFNLYIENAVFLGNHGVYEIDENILVLLGSEKLFESEIDSWIDSAHFLKPPSLSIQ